MTGQAKRILQIGTGRWGMNHLRNLRALGADLYVSDLRPEAYEKCCKSLGIPPDRFSTDHRQFLERVDAVDVVTPADSHFALVRDALALGKDVFVEKPITLDSREAEILVADAERGRRILQVGYIFRFDPAAVWARDGVREGRFGSLRMLRGRFAGFKRPRSDTGVLLADGIHFIDLLDFILDRLPGRVQAVLRDYLGRGMDDEAWLGLDYGGGEPGTWCTIECGYHVPGKARELVIIGSELTAKCDFGEPRDKVTTWRNRHVLKGKEWGAEEGGEEKVSFEQREPLRDELSAFIASIDTREPPRADGRSGLESLRVLEAALASAREGRASGIGEIL